MVSDTVISTEIDLAPSGTPSLFKSKPFGPEPPGNNCESSSKSGASRAESYNPSPSSTTENNVHLNPGIVSV